MPIGFSIHPEVCLIKTFHTGHITRREFVQAYRDIFAAPEFRPGLCEFADLRQMTEQSASTAEFRQVALMSRQAHGPLIRQVRVAILVKTQLQYGMSRMYGAHAELQDSETVETFHDAAAALAWLRGEPDGSSLHARACGAVSLLN